MFGELQDLALDYLPRLPHRKDFRIGCIGAGFIMRDCHLVAYRGAGFNPIAIASRDPGRAHTVAQSHGIERCYKGHEELLRDKDVEVLDIAVPPDVQPAIIHEAARHADHIRGILAQKPLAMSVQEAKACVNVCARAGITLAVNQNMRYDQSVRAVKDLLRRGWLGEPVLATIEMRAIPHWMPWSERLHSLSTFIMSIHHLDTFRYWLGTPDRVLASTRPDPRTRFPHSDGINLYILEYDSGCRASAWDDVWAGPARRKQGATSLFAGASKGPRAWPKAQSAGQAIPRELPARSISRRRGSRVTCSSRVGKRFGFQTPLRAPWHSSYVRWRTEWNRKSVGVTTLKQSLCAKPCKRRVADTRQRRHGIFSSASSRLTFGVRARGQRETQRKCRK